MCKVVDANGSEAQANGRGDRLRLCGNLQLGLRLATAQGSQPIAPAVASRAGMMSAGVHTAAAQHGMSVPSHRLASTKRSAHPKHSTRREGAASMPHAKLMPTATAAHWKPGATGQGPAVAASSLTAPKISDSLPASVCQQVGGVHVGLRAAGACAGGQCTARLSAAALHPGRYATYAPSTPARGCLLGWHTLCCPTGWPSATCRGCC